MVTIQVLREKIALVQAELAEVSAALEELADQPTEPTLAVPQPPTPRSDAHAPKFSDPRTVLAHVDRAFAELGIDVTHPALTPEEVQQLMLSEGVDPEDRILSRGIVEAREE